MWEEREREKTCTVSSPYDFSYPIKQALIMMIIIKIIIIIVMLSCNCYCNSLTRRLLIWELEGGTKENSDIHVNNNFIYQIRQVKHSYTQQA